MKKCCRCKKEKPIHEFNFRNKSLQIKQKSCKECTRYQLRVHYNNNRQYYLNKARRRNKENRNLVKRFIWTYLKNHPCVDCGEKDPIVLDFDHQRDKVDSLAMIVRNRQTMKTIESEISKCVVRCANCHRRKTAKDYKWYKYKFASVA